MFEEWTDCLTFPLGGILLSSRGMIQSAVTKRLGDLQEDLSRMPGLTENQQLLLAQAIHNFVESVLTDVIDTAMSSGVSEAERRIINRLRAAGLPV